MNFSSFFTLATGGRQPYPYQQQFFAASTEVPVVLSVPTGVGKTATAVLGWLWRRRFAADSVRSVTPRRLVYCLPMRTLVEQTYQECERWLTAANLSPQDVGLHVLMGGATNRTTPVVLTVNGISTPSEMQ